MSASLRFVLALLGLAALAAPVSVFMIYRQDDRQARIAAEQMTGGDVDAGRLVFARYGCGGCHRATGIAGAQGLVGPSLDGVAARAEIAGRLSNGPANMTLWLRHPQRVTPGNGMPDQGIGDQEARDLAALLYTLRK